MLELGLKFQNFPGLGKWAARAASPVYTRLEWQSMPDVDPESIDWAEDVPGDPDAGFLARNWKTAAVLGTSRQALASLGAHHPDSQSYARDAVAYDHDGIVVVGMNPESPHLFGGTPAWYNGDDILTIAMRRGTGPLRAAMGLYREDEGLMVPEEAAIVVQPSIPNRALPDKFPHTQLV